MREEFRDVLSLMVITEEGIFHYAHSTGAQIARRDKITKIKPGKLLKSLNIDYMDNETKRYFSVTCSNKAEFDRLVKAYEQFSKHVGVPLNKELTPEDFGINLEALLPVPDSKEFRKHCNVCGHVYCYTMGDLRRNQQLIRQSERESKLGLVQTLGSSQLMGKMNMDSAQQKLDQVVDYTRCPNCHSKDVSDIPDGEPISASETPAASTVVSPAAPAASAMDELKKLKELLDMGIVTQEEFDAKKKQLLGL